MTYIASKIHASGFGYVLICQKVFVTQRKVHLARKNAFYRALRQNNEGTHKLAFDLQQVHPLPKVPVQEAFYSRQLALYNFTICDVTENTNASYTWIETQAARGSNEVSSALNHYLTKVFAKTEDSANATKLELFVMVVVDKTKTTL